MILFLLIWILGKKEADLKCSGLNLFIDTCRVCVCFERVKQNNRGEGRGGGDN